MTLNKKAISVNILFSLLQIIITGLVYYFLYKYLLKNIGLNLMGVWTIVLSISSTANIANLGIGSGVVRFTALFKSNNENEQINKLIHTSLLLIAGFFFAIIVIVYFIAPYWLNLVVDNKYYESAIAILPYSLACLFFNALAGIYASCIDGLQKNYLRSLIYILSFVVLFVGAVLLVPSHGIMGIAYAQLLQAVFLFAGMATCLKTIFRPYRVFSLTWDRPIFKKIFSFGIQEQVISLCQLCFDPLTKSMLSSFGSLAMVSYYEMASRLVVQLRGLLVSANQVFVPIFTNAQQKSSETTKGLYRQVYSINFLLSILWVSFLLATVIPISKIWIEHVNADFIRITILLTTAYFFNIIISPAYFSNVGRADLKYNVVSNIIIAVLNPLLGYVLGHLLGGNGVVIGWCIALCSGSFYIFYTYHKKHSLPFKSLILKEDLYIILVCVPYSVGIFTLFYFNSLMSAWHMFIIAISFFSIIALIVYKVHPVGKVANRILRRA